MATLTSVEIPEKPDELIELDTDLANRIVKFLGNQPWALVNPVMQDFQDLLTAYISNYNFATNCVEGKNANSSNN